EPFHQLARWEGPERLRRQLAPADRTFEPLPELRRVEQLRIPLGHARQVDAVEMEGEGALVGVHVLDAADETEAREQEERIEVGREPPLHAAVEVERVGQ